MTLIPAAVLKRWNKIADEASRNYLAIFIEFREWDAELQHGEKMQAYREAAAAVMMSESTFRDKFGLVKRFQDDDLIRWFRRGISFDHLDKAPSLAEACKRTPSDLLEAAISIGNESGETMTVEEMTAFALAETDQPKASVNYHIESLVTSNLRKLRNLFKWDDDKAERFAIAFRDLLKEYVA